MTKAQLLDGCSIEDLRAAIDLKNRDGRTGCLGKAAADEPLFVIRSTDRTGPKAVRQWAHAAKGIGASQKKVNGAMEDALQMEIWQAAHPDLVKTPTNAPTGSSAVESREMKARLDGLRREAGCQHCPAGHGFLSRLEFAHLAPTGLNGEGRGLEERFYDVKWHRDLYAVLCRACHLLLDSSQWGPLDLAVVRARRPAEEVWTRWLGPAEGRRKPRAVGPDTVGGSTRIVSARGVEEPIRRKRNSRGGQDGSDDRPDAGADVHAGRRARSVA